MADEPKTEGGRGLPDGLREAIEGAFAATGKTRGRAQDLSGRTKDRAQGLVDEVSKRGLDARGTLDGLRLVNRDELRALELEVERLSERLSRLESQSSSETDG
jgi:polyhydroxyalkanoate synthesis regulator phasin